MADRGELERIEVNVALARRLLEDSGRALVTCNRIAQDDPKSVLLLAWDGVAFQLLAAALALAGYRVTNRQGHHRVAVEAVRELFDSDALFFRIRNLRRSRDRSMYENQPPPVDEVEEALADCQELERLLAAAIDKAR